MFGIVIVAIVSVVVVVLQFCFSAFSEVVIASQNKVALQPFRKHSRSMVRFDKSCSIFFSVTKFSMDFHWHAHKYMCVDIYAVHSNKNEPKEDEDKENGKNEDKEKTTV